MSLASCVPRNGSGRGLPAPPQLATRADGCRAGKRSQEPSASPKKRVCRCFSRLVAVRRRRLAHLMKTTVAGSWALAPSCGAISAFVSIQATIGPFIRRLCALPAQPKPSLWGEDAEARGGRWAEAGQNGATRRRSRGGPRLRGRARRASGRWSRRRAAIGGAFLWDALGSCRSKSRTRACASSQATLPGIARSNSATSPLAPAAAENLEHQQIPTLVN